MNRPTNRREVLSYTGAVSAISAAIAIAGSAIAAGPPRAEAIDHDLERHFSNWKDALHRINTDDGDEVHDAPLWDLLYSAENAIMTAGAATRRFAVMALWIGLQHQFGRTDDDAAIIREDIADLVARSKDYDWEIRCQIQALRALVECGL